MKSNNTSLIILSLVILLALGGGGIAAQSDNNNSFSFNLKHHPIALHTPNIPQLTTPISLLHTKNYKSVPVRPLPNSTVLVAEVALGVPPVKTHLILQTLTPFTWVQCSTLPTPPPRRLRQSSSAVDGFDPLKSKSFVPMISTHPLCTPPLFSDSGKFCAFAFDDVIGDYAFEKFFTSAHVSVHPTVPFGCGILPGNVLFKDQAPIGRLGLGQGHRTNILSHLKVSRFSYCIPPLHGISTASLDFGAAARLTGAAVKTTRMLRRRRGSQAGDLYYLNVTGIMVNGVCIDIGADSFAPKAGGGGIVIDPVVTFTFLANPAYHSLKEAVVEFFAGAYGLRPAEPRVGGLELCYNISVAVAPSLVFELEGGAADLEVVNGVPFLYLDDVAQSCMSVIPAVGLSPSIVGLRGQTGYKFLYDVAASTLSFAPDRC